MREKGNFFCKVREKSNFFSHIAKCGKKSTTFFPAKAQFAVNKVKIKKKELFLLILTRVSQIKAWLLDNTVVCNFFSNLSIIGKTGKAVQETNNASAPLRFNLDKTS